MAYGFYHSLTIDHTQVSATLSNYPVLVNFTDANLATVANGGHVTSSSGFDIGFFSDTGANNKLNWEIERYTATTGEVVAWVKLPTVNSGPPNTVFYIFYGDSTITTDQSTPTGVWDADFMGVYHMKDGSTLSVLDSTTQHNGTNNGATAGAGEIDGCGSFASASSQYIDLGSAMNPQKITLQAWANGTTFPNAYNAVVARVGASSFSYIFVKSTGKLAMGVVVGAGINVTYDGTGSNTLSAGTWYNLFLTYDGTTLTGYVNGSSDATATQSGLINTASTPMSIGRDPFNSGRLFNGLIDEVRISDLARSSAWISAEYTFHKQNTTVVIHGNQTPASFGYLYGWS